MHQRRGCCVAYRVFMQGLVSQKFTLSFYSDPPVSNACLTFKDQGESAVVSRRWGTWKVWMDCRIPAGGVLPRNSSVPAERSGPGYEQPG